MNKRANKELFLAKIVIAIALVAIFVAGLWMFIGQDTIAVQSAKEAYSLYMIENPEATDKDFIYIYEDTVIVAIRNGKVVRKEYATEADAVKAALGSKDGANYSLAGTGNGKLFVVKLFEKTDDIYALGTSTLATGAEKLTIKVVSNGMIFATFDIPAEAIDRKQSPVGVTIKKINAEDYITLREDQGGFGYDIDVTNLVENNTARIAITINGPKGLVADANKSPITAYHKDKNIASTYEPETGLISFSTTSFSPFPFVIENQVTVNTLDELRYYLQHTDSWNIILGQTIDIDLNKLVDGKYVNRHTASETDTKANTQYKGTSPLTGKEESIFYSRGYYDTDGKENEGWLYFGAIVRGFKYLDLNGHTITYTGDTTAGDSALFCVDGGTLFGIGDEPDDPTKKGVIKMGIDHYAVWSVENTSAVGIYGGVFVSSTYNTENEPNPNRALIYSSAGEIRAYGGYFLFKNSNYVDKLDNDDKPVVDEEGNPVKESKTNGGFNVLNKITQPRIWIHPGAYMSDKIYRQELDKNTIVLVGGKELYESEVTYGTEKLYTVKSSDLQVALKYTDKFLYRIGNTGSVPLKYLFKSKNANGDLVDADFTDMSVRVVDILKTDEYLKGLGKDYSSTDYYGKVSEKTVKVGDVANGKFTFSETFTGLVRLDLYNATTNAVYAQLFLEVVDGTNVATYDELTKVTSGNRVLLNNITMSEGGSFSLSNATLYGNGFTFDVTDGVVAGSGTVTGNYLVSLSNANLDNIQIVGPVYSDCSVTTDANYNRPVVLTNGTCGIYNSYISNAASPIRAYGGNLTIVNTTLKGGALANLDMRGGDLILDDVTTINQVNGNDPYNDKKTIIGLGIVVWYEGPNGKETIKIQDVDGDGKKDLTQYNYIASTHTGKNYFADAAVTAKLDKVLFNEDKFENNVVKDDSGVDPSLRYTDSNGVHWVNAGILTLKKTVNSSQVSTPDNYGWDDVSYTYHTIKYDGNLCTRLQTGFPEDPSSVAPAPYEPSMQYPILPAPDWDLPEKDKDPNYVPITESDKTYCYYDTASKTIKIRFENTAGNSFTFNPNILTATKLGNSLTVSVAEIKKDGQKFSGTTFTEAGDYEIVYTYTDPYNYRLGEDGVESYNVKYSKMLKIRVDLADASVLPAEFDFNGNGYKKVTIGEKTYIMPNVSATSGTIGKQSNGVYYPIVKTWYTNNKKNSGKLTQYDGSYTLPGSSKSTVYCPVFDGVITITEPTSKKTYGANTTDMAEGKLSLVSDGGGLTWSSSSKPDYDPDIKDGKQYFASVELDSPSKGRAQLNYIFEYSYTDDAKNTYYYYVQYQFPAMSECVTADTLITLTDGSQVRVDSLTGKEQLLVWNLKTGKYEAAPIVFVDSETEQEYEIIHLYFSDGSDVKVISEHGFFDLDLGKYVYIDAENYADYVGHRFVSEGDISKDTWNVVTLDKVNIETEVTTAWSPVTFEHLCYYTNGVLSMPGGIEGLFNIFEVDTDTMTYDAEKMAQDIETYGLLTLEDFGGMIPQAAFDAFNGQYLNVAIGKGLLTWEQIAALAERYVPLM